MLDRRLFLSVAAALSFSATAAEGSPTPKEARSPKLSWGHVNINVRQLERSVEFYQLLGFSVLMSGIPYIGVDNAKPPLPLPKEVSIALDVPEGARARSVIMELQGGFPKIDLTEYAGMEQRKPLQNSDLGLPRFCLLSQDLRADYDYLREHEVAFLSEPKVAASGFANVAICKDPDGTLIELLQPHLDRPWTLPTRP